MRRIIDAQPPVSFLSRSANNPPRFVPIRPSIVGRWKFQYRERRCWLPFWTASLLALFGTARICHAQGPSAPNAAIVNFAADIAPILERRCVACHGLDKQEGGLRLDGGPAALAGGDSGPAVTPGNSAASLLIEKISAAMKDERMPPEGDPLEDRQVALLRAWIDQGASWPNDLVLRAPLKADLTWWSLQPLTVSEPPRINELLPGWNDHPIDRYIAAGLDQQGLSPSPPADRRTLIRRATYDLIGLPPSTEEVDAFVADKSPDAYEKVIDRLLQSPHYGEHWGRHWLDVVRFGESNGFERNVIINNLWPFRDYVIRCFNEDKPFDQLIVEHLAGDVVGQGQPAVEVAGAFLVAGPYDNVGNQDAAQAKVIRANTVDEMVTATGAAFLGLTVNCARCHDHKFDPIQQADYYRMYASLSGVVHGERALGGLPDTGSGPEVPATVWAGNFQQPETTYLMRGGDPAKPGEEIAPGSLSVLARAAPTYELPANAPEAERRMALAKWLSPKDNPLVARVLANRIWHYHVGAGIVDTPSDFGYLGGRPTHPELLDWLALSLRRHGWRIKPLHREIMLSQSYRQSSAFRDAMAKIDSSARLLWRFPPRRLGSEEIRDTMLFVSGKLDWRRGGPGFRLYQYVEDNVATYVPLDEHPPETYRRAVYHQNARASNVDVLSDFDGPDCALPTPRRGQTTTPLQALAMLNHSFTRDMANALAERVVGETGPQPEDQVRRLFKLAYSREPTSEEHHAAVQFVASRSLSSLCRVVMNSNELIFID